MGDVESSDELSPPARGDDWLGLTSAPLPVGQATDWAVRPDCGAVVTFCGTARDHAEGRPGVTELEYEAYEEQVVPRLATIAGEARRQWDLGRLVLHHRVGPVAVGETSVVVVASSAHRQEAFSAARFAIDRLKATVPIWKREAWAGGEDWGLDGTLIDDITGVHPPDANSPERRHPEEPSLSASTGRNIASDSAN